MSSFSESVKVQLPVGPIAKPPVPDPDVKPPGPAGWYSRRQRTKSHFWTGVKFKCGRIKNWDDVEPADLGEQCRCCS